MAKQMEITVTYRLTALDENDALEQVFTHRVEPETVDVIDLPVIPTPRIEMVNF
jgi:hypothetical protein